MPWGRNLKSQSFLAIKMLCQQASCSSEVVICLRELLLAKQAFALGQFAGFCSFLAGDGCLSQLCLRATRLPLFTFHGAIKQPISIHNRGRESGEP